jgi:hypothetical protein
MDRSAARTLRLLREVTDTQEHCAEAKDFPQIASSACSSVGKSAERCVEIVEESLSANERLAVYEKVADDETAALELRMLLAHRANVLRILSRLGTKPITRQFEAGEAPKTSGAHLVNGDGAEALLFSPIRIAGDLRQRANEACRKLLAHGVNRQESFPARIQGFFRRK